MIRLVAQSRLVCPDFAPTALLALRHHTIFLQTAIVACAVLVSCTCAVAQTETATVTLGEWIERLGHDSFHERQRAKRELLKLSEQIDLTQSLKQAKRHPMLEIRDASAEILDQLALAHFDRQLDRLRQPETDAKTISLPFWDHYSSIAGTDFAARELFRRIACERAELLYWMQHAKDRDRGKKRSDAEKKSIVQVSTLFDPYRMNAADTPLWALIFCCDSGSVDHGLPNLTLRVAMALSQSGLGPRTVLDIDSIVIGRLVDHWLRDNPNVGTKRDRLTIAMRYNCHQLAQQISRQVLGDSISAPSDQTIAMLCVSILGGTDLERLLELRLHDERTAHGWHLIASRKTKIRTQVRDVALALLLHHHGIDPRQVGFHELQADPLLMFRDQSLGFPNEEKRQEAYRAAEAALAKVSGRK